MTSISLDLKQDFISIWGFLKNHPLMFSIFLILQITSGYILKIYGIAELTGFQQLLMTIIAFVIVTSGEYLVGKGDAVIDIPFIDIM